MAPAILAATSPRREAKQINVTGGNGEDGIRTLVHPRRRRPERHRAAPAFSVSSTSVLSRLDQCVRRGAGQGKHRRGAAPSTIARVPGGRPFGPREAINGPRHHGLGQRQPATHARLFAATKGYTSLRVSPAPPFVLGQKSIEESRLHNCAPTWAAEKADVSAARTAAGGLMSSSRWRKRIKQCVIHRDPPEPKTAGNHAAQDFARTAAQGKDVIQLQQEGERSH